jgi:hypothetical protein
MSAIVSISPEKRVPSEMIDEQFATSFPKANLVDTAQEGLSIHRSLGTKTKKKRL